VFSVFNKLKSVNETVDGTVKCKVEVKFSASLSVGSATHPLKHSLLKFSNNL
jgi:hypothetical protein